MSQNVDSRPVYRGALTVGLLALAAFVLVGVLVASGVSSTLDNWILVSLHQLAAPGVISLALTVSLLGSEAVNVLLPLSALVLWLGRKRWQAAEVVIATGGAQIANDLLKLVFHRDRPAGIAIASSIPGQGYSFPSGHVMVSIAFYGALAYIGWRVLRGWQRTAWMVAMAVVVLAIAVSRLILGVHYPTDVLASWAAGLLWLDITLVAVGYVHQRRSERRAPAEQPSPAPAP